MMLYCKVVSIVIYLLPSFTEQNILPGSDSVWWHTGKQKPCPRCGQTFSFVIQHSLLAFSAAILAHGAFSDGVDNTLSEDRMQSFKLWVSVDWVINGPSSRWALGKTLWD